MTGEAGERGQRTDPIVQWPDAPVPQMIDIAFELHGDTLARDYQLGLWDAVMARLPWLAEAPFAGLHPLRVPATLDARVLLPARAKLVLRVPVARAEDAMALAQSTLEVCGDPLHVGASRSKPLYPHPTVHADFVLAQRPDETVDETGFHAGVAQLLSLEGKPPAHICGRMKSIRVGSRTLHGAAVVVHGLRPAQSLQWQYAGLGAGRHFGCGLMVPHKNISGLDQE